MAGCCTNCTPVRIKSLKPVARMRGGNIDFVPLPFDTCTPLTFTLTTFNRGGFGTALNGITVPTTGTYRIDGTAYMTAPVNFLNDSGGELYVTVNGARVYQLDYFKYITGGTLVISSAAFHGTQMLQLNAGDVVGLEFNNNAVGNQIAARVLGVELL